MLIVPIYPEDAFYLTILHEQCMIHPWTEKSFTDLLHLKTTIGFAAHIRNDLIGFIMAVHVKEQAEILTLAVSPLHRRRGVAAELIKALERQVKAWKAEQLFLEVEETNIPALNLYKKLEYKPFNKRPNYYQSGDAALMLVKKIY